MPISDSSPERKNLILISLAFILYYAAGGRFHGGEIRFFVVNLQFSKPAVLGMFAWVLLFWFALRFYQQTHMVYRKELWAEVRRGGVPELLSVKACRLAKEQLRGANHADHFERNVYAQDIRPNGYLGISIVCNFSDDSGPIVHQKVVKLGGIQGLAYRVREVVSHVITGNAAAEHLIPYVLFVAAALGPFWSQNT